MVKDECERLDQSQVSSGNIKSFSSTVHVELAVMSVTSLSNQDKDVFCSIGRQCQQSKRLSLMSPKLMGHLWSQRL